MGAPFSKTGPTTLADIWRWQKPHLEKLAFSNLKVWPTSQLTDIAESPFIGWLTKHGLFYSMLISIHMFTYWQVFICVCLHFKIYFCRVWRPGQACCFTQTETHWKQNLSKAKSKAMESSGRDPTMKTSIQFVPFFWEQIWEFWVVKDTVQGQIWGNLCFRPHLHCKRWVHRQWQLFLTRGCHLGHHWCDVGHWELFFPDCFPLSTTLESHPGLLPPSLCAAFAFALLSRVYFGWRYW